MPAKSIAHLRMAGLAAVVAAGLVACSSSSDQYVERPVEDLYNEAMDLLEKGERQAAAAAFDEVERQHPYSSWATKAQLMAAYSYYEDNKYDDAVVALDRFIQLHPGHRDVAYAYYLKGLSYYEQITDVSRDQKMTELSTEALREVVTRFPNSQYARDARLKLDLTIDHLAGKEMEIGRYYLRQRHYLAAINRFKTVVTQFQTTTHVPEALHRLVECYTTLGLGDDARKTAAVLGHNFPGSPWYQDSYRQVEGVVGGEEPERGWFSQAWDWVRGGDAKAGPPPQDEPGVGEDGGGRENTRNGSGGLMMGGTRPVGGERRTPPQDGTDARSPVDP